MKIYKFINILLSVNRNTFIVLFACSIPFISIAQQEKKFIRDGNKNYEEKKFTEAKALYDVITVSGMTSQGNAFGLQDAYWKCFDAAFDNNKEESIL